MLTKLESCCVEAATFAKLASRPKQNCEMSRDILPSYQPSSLTVVGSSQLHHIIPRCAVDMCMFIYIIYIYCMSPRHPHLWSILGVSWSHEISPRHLPKASSQYPSPHWLLVKSSETISSRTWIYHISGDGSKPLVTIHPYLIRIHEAAIFRYLGCQGFDS